MNIKKSLKKYIATGLALATCCAFAIGCIGCKNDPTVLPNQGGKGGGDTTMLIEQDFDNAIDAYIFGENLLKNTADYETVSYATATAVGVDTYTVSKSYKSSTTNDFLYETTTYGQKSFDVEPTFALKIYKKDNADTVYYARVNGKSGKSSAKLNPDYSTDTFKGATANYEDVEAKTCKDIAEMKKDVTGTDVTAVTSYFINKNTIKRVIDFNKDETDGSFTFSLSLKENALTDYKKQVALFSNQKYSKFNAQKWEDGLVLKFTMDKFGRFLSIESKENYSVSVSFVTPEITVNSVQYIDYSKQPIIDILSGNTFNGPQITYANQSESPDESAQ